MHVCVYVSRWQGRGEYRGRGILTVRGEPLVVVEPVRQLNELAHVQLGQLALQQRLLQVQLRVSGRLALALLAPRLPGTPSQTHHHRELTYIIHGSYPELTRQRPPMCIKLGAGTRNGSRAEHVSAATS